MVSQPLVDGVGLFVVKKLGLGINLAELTARVEEIFADKSCVLSPSQDYIACNPAPLEFLLSDFSLATPSCRINIVRVRIWEFGAVSFYFSCSFPDALVAKEVIQALPLLQTAVLEFSTTLSDRLREAMAEHIQRPINNKITEEWAVFTLPKSLGLTIDSLFNYHSSELSRLLWVDDDANSADITAEIRSGSFARNAKDFLLIDWDCGLLVSDKASQILQVVEYALMQSLEMRCLIAHLDRNLDNFLERFKSGWPIYTLGLKQFSSLSIEATWVYDRIAESLDLAGNPLLLEIYQLASKRFRLSSFDEDIQRKMAALREVYERFHDQNHIVIAHILELTIILLIMLEIVINLA